MRASSALGVPGFRAAGVHCGVKRLGLDLALIASDRPARAAGVFTRSTIVGAPVELTRDRVRAGCARAIVVNSGVSNVAMGEQGRRDAAEMARCAAAQLGAPAEQVLVASTGVIGVRLPMPRIRRGIRHAAAALAPAGLCDAAEAIRTTDTRAKTALATARVDGREVTIAGIAKGSGMIEPDMATMLAFLLTDAAVSAPHLARVLGDAADASFNRLSVDGETSTSDMALLLANGAAGNRELRGPRSPGAAAFAAAVERVAVALAREIARDGEGATKLVTVRVEGAASARDAERAARRIANSMLVKTALYGGDANWGRILQTVGAARVRVNLDRARVRLSGVTVFREGTSAGPGARKRAARALQAHEVELAVELGAGRAAAQV
ncbi:MAG TPA: bifunctional glutamate N-acetyltransferase/amino-acid acetyltransferase ArgJ, partial [Myxococcota bacterium]|nr:bifunctional glutamate N-acetyltransferase/amino-acid acetyltransferase ArgJ [Myxococcota bacterium]